MFRKCCLFLQGLNVHSRPQRALDEWQLTIEEHFWPHKVSYCFACTVFLCHICIPVPVPSGKHWLFLLLHCWCNWHQIILLLLCLLCCCWIILCDFFAFLSCGGGCGSCCCTAFGIKGWFIPIVPVEFCSCCFSCPALSNIFTFRSFYLQTRLIFWKDCYDCPLVST